MLDAQLARRFADEWLDAWNAHDLERILAHWADACVFTSPLALKLMGDATVRGKPALRAYWARGLQANPALRFGDLALFVGHDSLVLHYRNHRGQSCAEWLRLTPAGLAIEGAAHNLA